MIKNLKFLWIYIFIVGCSDSDNAISGQQQFEDRKEKFIIGDGCYFMKKELKDKTPCHLRSSFEQVVYEANLVSLLAKNFKDKSPVNFSISDVYAHGPYCEKVAREWSQCSANE